MEITTIKTAFITLYSPESRKAYDSYLDASNRSNFGPRPAQIVSLEDFDEDNEAWKYPCRCGGLYRITEGDMEKDIHMVGCDLCSEMIWVGFEPAAE